jgi:hypothetical protein
MNDLEKGLILAELADRLIAQGSWCGHTHLQKAVYFLQELLEVDLGLKYILYKHGPYSFDLEEVLLWCQSSFLLEKDYKASGYGPRLKPTGISKDHRSRFPRLLARHTRELSFVAERLGSKGVVGLERLATALFVSRELGDEVTLGQRVSRLRDYKPHISETDAHEAFTEFDEVARDAVKLRSFD